MRGKDEDLIRMAQQMGQPLPDRIKNRPELEDHLAFYYQAFLDLDSTRSHNMSPTPISWLSIVKYASFYQLDDEDTHDLIKIIKEMDSVILKHIAKTFKVKNKSNEFH